MRSIVPHSLNSSTAYCYRPSGYDSILLFSVQSVRKKKYIIQVDNIPSSYLSVQSVRKKKSVRKKRTSKWIIFHPIIFRSIRAQKKSVRKETSVCEKK